jgi:hypothetical protein
MDEPIREDGFLVAELLPSSHFGKFEAVQYHATKDAAENDAKSRAVTTIPLVVIPVTRFVRR